MLITHVCFSAHGYATAGLITCAISMKEVLIPLSTLFITAVFNSLISIFRFVSDEETPRITTDELVRTKGLMRLGKSE